MSDKFEITQLEEMIDQMQELIASLELDIELMKLEIIHRGDEIKRLEVQNHTLKNQLMKRTVEDVKIPMLLKPKEQDGKVC